MRYFAPKIQQLTPLSMVSTLLCLCLALTLTIIAVTPSGISIEQSTGLRLFFWLRGPIPAPKNLALIVLNSTAAENLSQSKYSGNWPRTIHAELIKRLGEVGARLTVMDIAFKDDHNELEDSALQQALQNNPLVILFTYLKRQQIDTGAGTMDIEQEIPPIARYHEHALASGSFTLPKYPAHVYSTTLFNQLYNGIAASQPLLAYLALQNTQDLQAVWQGSGQNQLLSSDLDARARQLLSAAKHIDTAALTSKQSNIVSILNHIAPLTINLYGPAHSLNTWPIDTALGMNDDEFQQAFSGKIVYIGFSDIDQTEQQDAYRTVFSSHLGVDLSGVEISATVFANLMNNDFIKTPSAWVLVASIVIALLLGFVSHQTPMPWNFIMQSACVGTYLVIAYVLFSLYQRWLPLALPALALILINSVVLARRFNINKKRIQQIQFALSQYLPSHAAIKLSRNANALEQQHQLVHGVCLMTDIQGYTSLSETLEPDVLHTLMNAYYAELVATVDEHGGFIGNLVGDGMLALWTGPSITPQMCQSAFAAAQRIQQRINNNPKLSHPLPTCTAIHGGQFSLGHLGATGHFEYSPVGDIINTASRVEHFNRNLGTTFLCTAPIAEQLKKVTNAASEITNNKINLRYLGRFIFRHKSCAMPLYSLSELLPEAELNRFEQAVMSYEQNEFELAGAIFEQLYQKYKDGPSQYYLNEMLNKHSTKF